MSFCIVPGCTNRKKNKNYVQLEKESRDNNIISFHIFPRDIERKKKWLEALNLQNYCPPKTGAVCSEHFKEQNYDSQHTLRKLKKDALPCLSEENAVNNQNNNSNIDDTEIMIQHHDIKIEENILNDEIRSINVDTSANENTDMKIEVNYRHRSTSVSPERLFNSPREVELRKLHRDEIRRLKKQLYASSYKLKRAQETVKSLRSIVKDLERRNSVTSQDSDILKHLDQGTKELIKREIRKKKKLPVNRKYKDALREFALSLHFQSPKAYNYVRHKFYNSLPHPKTISQWYQSVDEEPGIITTDVPTNELPDTSVVGE
ncbi:uncharacterized protein LOC143372897 isoform X1 [Andrena cerasifolii]|uniref:uncharacterized protein LOC143372897 isoform X1 n=1 Tax=Andrena cerasifolii TaxID=2819439 RepID=UPI00403822BB